VWFGVAGRLPPFGWTWRRCTLGGGGSSHQRSVGGRWILRRRAHGRADSACAGPHLPAGMRNTKGLPVGLVPRVPISTGCSVTLTSS